MKFTHIFKLLAVAAVGLFVATGCVTTSGMPQADTSVTKHQSKYSGPAYLIAYGATTTYLTEKPNVDEQVQSCVNLSWDVYHSVMVDLDEENFNNVEQLLQDELARRLEGKAEDYASLAIQIFSTYVNRVKSRYDFSAMKRSEVYEVLKAVHDGIADAIDDYNTVNSVSKTPDPLVPTTPPPPAVRPRELVAALESEPQA